MKLPNLMQALPTRSCMTKQFKEVGTRPQDGSGTWVAKTFSQVNIFCLQKWTCEPPSIIYDSGTHTLKTTGSEVTTGACSAGGGSPTSCNHCIATPPATQCKYWLEPR